MNFEFSIPTKLMIRATGVNSAEHAVNRVRKYLKENCFTVADDGTYRPETGRVNITFNEMTTADDVSLDTIVNPPTWFSDKEKERILGWCDGVIRGPTMDKLIRVLEQEAH